MRSVATFLATICVGFLSLTGVACAGNLFNDAGTSKAFASQLTGHSQTINGTSADTIDDPASPTEWTAYAENSGIGGNDVVTATWDLTFASPVSLTSIAGNLSIWSSETGTTDRLRDGHFSVTYRDSPAGSLLPLLYRSYGPDGGDGQSTLVFNGTDPLSVSSASEVQIEFFAEAFANNGRTNGSANAFVGITDIELGGQVVPEPSGFFLLGFAYLLSVSGCGRRQRETGIRRAQTWQ